LVSGGAFLGTDQRKTALVTGLAERGFVEGRNIAFAIRLGGGQGERLAALVAELNDWKADVIVTLGYPAALAGKQSPVKVPVVVMGAGDPVATGLVDGLARPGGNVTGMTEMSTELSAKRLELLKEAVPNVKLVAMLWNAADLGMTMRYRAAEDAARILGVSVQALGVREPDDFDLAFATMTRDRPDAILMVSDALTMLNRKRIMEFASATSLPALYEQSSLVRDGGLMSYGPSQRILGERVADFVARILRGAQPADLPLEQPTTFELVINLKTAASLGLTFPPSLLARADEVIE
jgi:putative ABC transport system substrate-binding protein